MKVVFLDFDGVIFTFGRYNFSAVACENVNYLLQLEPDLKIVVSSSWRTFGTDQVKKTLQAHGIDSTKVIDITGDEDGERGTQVKSWLDRHTEVTNFVVLDDESDFSNMMGHLVKTDPHIGLTEADVKKAIDILKKPV